MACLILGDKASQIPIQFFGTDVSETSVTRRATGGYIQEHSG